MSFNSGQSFSVFALNRSTNYCLSLAVVMVLRMQSLQSNQLTLELVANYIKHPDMRSR